MRVAYAPYSEFKVGAAVRARSGAIYAGANVENVAYPQGQCAEASALGALVAPGRSAITAVAVVAERVEVCPPCGGCRQRLAEFGDAETPVYLGAARGDAQRLPWPSCLPLSFGRASWGDERGRRRPGGALRVAPRVGVVLGSGLGAVADAVSDAVVVSYDGAPRLSAPDRGGACRAGRAGSRSPESRSRCSRVARTCTRMVIPMDALRVPVRALRAAGAEILVLTNAAGSLRPEVGPGWLMAITDHINLTGINVLMGPNDDSVGPRFPPMRDAYDPALLAELARRGCARSGSPLAEGVYLAVSGPSFETPAEIRAFQTAGRRRGRHVDRARDDPWRATAGCGWPPCRRSPTSPRA